MTAAKSLLASSNTKIPISLASDGGGSSRSIGATASQKDDEFDADIDMVDFLAKSQQQQPSSPSSASGNDNSPGNDGNESDKFAAPT